MQRVVLKDLGQMDYQLAWDYQEALLQENVRIKAEMRQLAETAAATAIRVGAAEAAAITATGDAAVAQADAGTSLEAERAPDTTHYLLLVEHPPVYTLGKSGHIENVLLGAGQMEERGVQLFRTNRGGDITFHGPGQLVGYPIIDLEKYYTDIGRYLRNLEEVGIRVLAEYGIAGGRSSGETGVWLEPGIKGRERKIMAIGVRCSRWVTMHGFALNVNTDLTWFGNIIPCGIADKQVTSLEKELGQPVPFDEVKEQWKRQFEHVFEARLV